MPDYLYEPQGWGDADWWRRPNQIKDVGEEHSHARREASRIRAKGWRRMQMRMFRERMGL